MPWNYLNLIFSDSPIRIYCCGMTVNGLPHVGHARSILVTLLIKKILNTLKRGVTVALNWTDMYPEMMIPDRPLITLRISNVRLHMARKQMIDFMGAWPIDFEPKVSEHFGSVKEDVRRLIRDKYAYVSGQDVILNARSYGKFNVDLKAMCAEDFYVWRSNPGGSRFLGGRGLPGWHIECCSMIRRVYGDKGVHLHLGGTDLKFPHHTNESLLFNLLNDGNLTQNWAHVGMVCNAGVKMSKSLNNHVMLADIPTRKATRVKLRLLASSYTQVINFNLKDVSRISYLIPRLNLLSDSIKGIEWGIIKVRSAVYLLRNELNLGGLMLNLQDRPLSWLSLLCHYNIVLDPRLIRLTRRWTRVTRLTRLRSWLKVRGDFYTSDLIRRWMRINYGIGCEDLGDKFFARPLL